MLEIIKRGAIFFFPFFSSFIAINRMKRNKCNIDLINFTIFLSFLGARLIYETRYLVLSCS